MTAGNRHSSNTNDRGSAEQRRQRKRWLFEIWGADVDVVTRDEFTDLISAMRAETDVPFGGQGDWEHGWQSGWLTVTRGLGRPAVRCFRCGKLCDWASVEIDRIKPGAEGGRYHRNNIRPVCEPCNKKLEGEARKRRNAKRLRRNQQARAYRARKKAQFEAEQAKCAAISANEYSVPTRYLIGVEGPPRIVIQQQRPE